jgi:hypothetical protein
MSRTLASHERFFCEIFIGGSSVRFLLLDQALAEFNCLVISPEKQKPRPYRLRFCAAGR